MADLYPYLIASLPALHFGMKPPFSMQQFLELCCPLIPEHDCRLLRTLPLPGQYPEPSVKDRTVRRWIEFDTALRNDLVRLRAGNLHRDPARFLRPGGSGIFSALPASITAALKATPLEAERTLDEARWKALDELLMGHYFDLPVLVTYAYKLMILWRWERIRDANGMALLEETLACRQESI